MGDTKTIIQSGLATSANPLATSGGYYTLENMVTDLRGWATKRNGMKLLSPSSSWNSVFTVSSDMAIVSAWYFDDHIWIYAEEAATGASGIAAYSMVTNAGWHRVVESTSRIRLDHNTQKLRAVTADRRQLINTTSGIKRVAAIYDDFFPKGSTIPVNYSSMYRNAGVPRALDPRCRNGVAGGASDHGLIAVTGYEWLTLSSAVAYRICWIKRDENAILGVGMPSGRIVVRNTSTTTNYATRLKTIIPSGVSDTSYVMQVFRTNVVSIDGAGIIPDPGDDMYLAGEYRVTATDLSNGYILYEDVSFDGILGAPLYTNENQEGPLAGRQQPPIARDMAVFGGSAFYANTTEKQRLIIKILAVDPGGPTKGIRIGDKLVMGDLVMEGVALASEDTQPWYFAVDVTTGAGSEVIRVLKTTESICYKYNQWSNARNGRYAAYNMTTNNDIVGVIMLEEKSIGGSTGAYLGIDRQDSPIQILPAPVFTATTANTLAQAVTVATNAGPTTVTLTYGANHNLTTGDLVFLAPFGNSTESGTSSPRFANTDVPAGVYRVTATGATTATFTAPAGAAASQTDTAAAAAGGYAHKIFDTTSSVWTEARSDNSRKINRMMWTPDGEPEGVPIDNWADIGAADKAIIRIVPTQDSLFIFKEDGTWRLKGEAGSWELVVLDKACIIAGSETPAVVDGRVFMYSTAGVVAVDDGGVSKVSGDVSGDLENLLRSVATNPTSAQSYVGCGHGETKSYWIAVPGYNSASRCAYRYHAPTRSWSKHKFLFNLETYQSANATPISSIFTAKASRYTSFDSQAYAERLVVCSSLRNVTPLIERRTGTVIDYSDKELAVTVNSFDTTASTATLASVTGVEVGDMLLWYNPANYVPGGYSFDPDDANNGKYRATISAINGNTVSLSISGNVPALSTWPAVGAGNSGSVLKQLRATAAPMPIVSGDGLSLMKFSEIVAAFGSCGRFSSCQFGFNTEVATATPGSFQATSEISGFAHADWMLFDYNLSDQTLQYIRTFRTGIPRAVSTGTYLIATLRNARACENFDIAGIRLIYTEGDNKTRRTNA